MGAELQILEGGKSPAGRTMRERFQAHVVVQGNPDDPAACHLWKGATHAKGHGIFCVTDGVNWAASRVAYVMAHAEPLVPSQVIVPTCATGKLCVRGSHYVLAKKPRKRPAHIARFDRAFKETAVMTVLDGRWSLEDVAKGLRVRPDTLQSWVRAAVKQARAHLNGNGVTPGRSEEENQNHDNDISLND